MEPLFHIGQKVVALKDNPQGFFKKGEEYEVLDTFLPPCKCKVYVVQINPFAGDFNAVCTDCYTRFTTSRVFFDQNDFAPLSDMGSMTFEEAIELVTVKEIV